MRSDPLHFVRLFAYLALLTLATLAAQQAPAQPAPTPGIRHDATTLLLPAGTLPIKDVINETAAFLHCNILFDVRELEAANSAVELQTPMQLDQHSAEDVLSDLLYARGFVLVPRAPEQHIYDVVNLRGPRAREVFTAAPQRPPDQILARPDLKQPVTTLVALQQLSAPIATNALRPMFAAAGGSASITLGTAGGNGLIVTGIQCDVARAIGVIREADAAAAPARATAPNGAAPAPSPDDRLAALERTVAALERRIVELERRLADRGAEKAALPAGR